MIDNQTGNPDYDWMEIGIPILMELDLYQDVFIDVSGTHDFAGLLAEAGIADQGAAPISLQRQLADRKYADWFTAGVVVETDGAPELRITVHNTKSGDSKPPIVVSTEDLFGSVDHVTAEIRRSLEVPSNYEGAKADLPLSQLITDSEAAFKEAALGYKAIMVDKDWPAASAALQRATEIDPGYAHAQLGLYTTRIAQNQAASAMEALNAAMANIYRLPERVQFLAKTEYFAFVRQDVPSAITVLEMATTLYPADVDALSLLGQFQEGTGNREGAVRAFNQLLEQDPNRVDALLQLGKLQERSGQYAEARAYYMRYIKARPTDKEGPLLLGGLETALGNHAGSLEHYRTATLLAPTDPSITTKMASAHFNQGDFGRALGQLEVAVSTAQTPSQQAAVQQALLHHHLARGQVQKSVEHFFAYRQALVASQPPIFVALGQQEGVLTLIAGRRDEELMQVIDDLANIPPPANQMVHALNLTIATENRDLGKIAELLPAMDSLIEQYGRVEFTSLRSYGQGLKAELEGDLEGALNAYDTALEILPLRSGWHEDAARVLRELARPEDAQKRIQMALTVGPMSGDLNLEAARVAMAQNDNAAAHEYLDAAQRVWSDADADYEPAKALGKLRQALPPRP